MSIIVPKNYYKMLCGRCKLKVETVDYQYEQCPRCHSHTITSARAERWEAYEAPASQQRQANEDVAKALKQHVIGGRE